MGNSSIKQAGSMFGRICAVFAATSALIVTTASPVIAQPDQSGSLSTSVESPAEPQSPAVPVDDRQQNVATDDDPAAVVEDLPEIAPETSLPAAPPPSDADSRSDGTEPASQVPTGRGGEARSAPQALQAETLDEPWEPTENPKATVEPGQMRSDREEIPEGFTKEDADKAETMEARLQDGGNALLRAAVAPGCQVYWPAPFEVCGAIRDKYNALGGPNSFLLFPKTGELTNPDRVGKRTEFVNGPIYWSPQGGAHPVVNHFLAAWARHGYEASYIGYPTTDEIVNPDGIGRRQHFTGSTIYWRLNEAYSIGGEIQKKWNSLGAERGALGYPISDELVLPDGQGRMNRFEKGVIYWHPSTGAHQVTGEILDHWSKVGYERSEYGYPVGDPQPLSENETFQAFEKRDIETPVYLNIDGISCSQLIARAVEELRIKGSYDFMCGTFGVAVKAFTGRAPLGPSVQARQMSGQPYGERDCDLEKPLVSGPALVQNFRVTKHVSMCMGRFTDDPDVSWSKEADVTYTFQQHERRFHTLYSSVASTDFPTDFTIDTEFHVRQDIPRARDREIAQRKGNFVQATPQGQGANEVYVDGNEGTYFVELRHYNVSIPSWDWVSSGSGKINMGRFRCPYFKPGTVGNPCAWTDPIDDHN